VPLAAEEDDFEDTDSVVGRAGLGGGKFKVVAGLLLLIAIAAGGYYFYVNHWVPEQQRKAADAKPPAPAPTAAAPTPPPPAPPAVEPTPTAAVPQPPPETAPAPEPAAAAPAAAPPAAAAPAPAPAKKEPVRDYDYYVAQGDRLREREKAEAALDAYGRAIELNPDRAEPHAGRGWALLDQGANFPAEASFQQALKLNPRYGVAIMGLAETYRAMGKSEQAVRYYEKYLEALPNGPEANVARTNIEKLKK
jgi:tetratricopeptide (TPR) repeat protein